MIKKGNKISTKDKIEPQHRHHKSVFVNRPLAL